MKKILLLTLILSFVIMPADAFFWNKAEKAKQAELEGKGYAGKLPNLNKSDSKKENKVMTPIFESQDGFNNPADLKPVPKDNPAFIDIVQKKGEPSKYDIDTTEIISIMEKLLDCIEENGSVQLFVTRTNVLTMNLDYLVETYQNKPEGNFESFKQLTKVNQYSKSIAKLRNEAETYKRYLAYQTTGSIYNPENINQQLEYLKTEINSAIILLKQGN